MAGGKLVRDKIPDIIRQNGGNPQTHIAVTIEIEQLLAKKLGEEAYEFFLAIKPEEKIEELADVLEVIDAICKYHGFKKKVLAMKRKKAREKGKFNKRIVLENS